MRRFFFYRNFATIVSMKITVTIISYNEEAKIGDAIRSAKWADEVLVIDAESTDDTVKIAADLGARVIIRPWPGFSEQKQFANDNASHDWIFSLDSDERISEVLRTEIGQISESDVDLDAYRIPRLTFYMGRPIRHCGWYPDHQLRLFDRRKSRWNGRIIHESVEMEPQSRIGKLRGEILHYSIDDATYHHRMIGERYAPLSAKHMFESGKRTSPAKIFTAGFTTFVRSYFLRFGVLDGLPGFAISRFAAHHAFLKHLLLWELQKNESSPE